MYKYIYIFCVCKLGYDVYLISTLTYLLFQNYFLYLWGNDSSLHARSKFPLFNISIDISHPRSISTLVRVPTGPCGFSSCLPYFRDSIILLKVDSPRYSIGKREKKEKKEEKKTSTPMLRMSFLFLFHFVILFFLFYSYKIYADEIRPKR